MEMKQPFERVVTQHGEAVLRVCRAVLGPHTDADDAWSETFLAAMQAYPELDERANIRAWLVTIAHRKAIDVIRTRQRHITAGDEIPEPTVTAAAGEDGAQDLWNAVKRLPDKQRKVLAYRYLAGLSYREVAEVLGGTPEAARRAAADGIEHLRREYRPDPDPIGATQ